MKWCRAIVSEFGAHFALVHQLTAFDISRGQQSETVTPTRLDGTQFHLTVSNAQLRRFLPDIYWWTYVGPEYVSLFSESRIRALADPAVVTQESDGYSIQLTERLEDARERSEFFEGLRASVKAQLDSGAFFDSSKGLESHYSVPLS